MLSSRHDSNNSINRLAGGDQDKVDAIAAGAERETPQIFRNSNVRMAVSRVVKPWSMRRRYCRAARQKSFGCQLCDCIARVASSSTAPNQRRSALDTAFFSAVNQ